MRPMRLSTSAVHLIVCAAVLAAGSSEIQLLPAGEFAPRDGRTAKWSLSDEQGQRLADQLNAASAKNAFLIDYEHQTLYAEKNGQPAPAAGWATKFEWRPGKGLFATDVAWTDRAAEHIKAGEYRYISPVFLTNKATGEILRVINAGLVNQPALPGMQEVAEKFAAKFLSDEPGSSSNPTEYSMKAIALLLGLPGEATEDQIAAAVHALKIKVDAGQSEVVALKAQVTTADTAVTALQTELNQLKASITAAERDALIEQALKDGKLAPAAKDWAKSLSLEALKGFVAVATPVTPGSQSGGKGAEGAGPLSAEAKEVCRMLGISEEDYLKTQKADAVTF
jgi:phage I-like protein